MKTMLIRLSWRVAAILARGYSQREVAGQRYTNVIQMQRLIRLSARQAAVGAIMATLVLAACGDGGSGDQSTPEGIEVVVQTPTGVTTPRPRRTPVVTPSPTPTPLKVCGNNPDPASPKLLQVLEPVPEQSVKVPFEVRGWGSNIGFNDVGVALAVVDEKQNVLQVLDLPPQPRDYRVAPRGLDVTEYTRPFGADIVVPPVKEPTPFCLWAYQETSESGSPRGVVQVPIVVLPGP